MKFFILLLLILLPIFSYSEETGAFKFSNSSGLSMIQTTGNTEIETYNLETQSEWKGEKRAVTLSGHYTLGYAEETDATTGESDKVETARNWDAKLGYEQIMSEHFSGYAAYQIEGNEFSGIAQRDNVDLGGKYYFSKEGKTTAFTELGLRYTVERRTVEDEDGEDIFNFNKGRVYYEINHKKSEDLSMKFWLEYLPNFTRSEDYIITYEPSLSYVLTSTFSLKTAYKTIYDNEPNVEGNKRTDTLYTTSIIAKF